MAIIIRDQKFPGIIGHDLKHVTADHDRERIDRSERHKSMAIFCLGFLFGGFVGFCGAWIIFDTLN